MERDGNGSDPNSCDEADLAEHEARLYSLIHHCSDSLEPATAQSTMQDFRINPYNSVSTLSNIQSSSTKSNNVVTTPNALEEPGAFRQSTRNRAFRMNQVQEIVCVSDRNESDNPQQFKSVNKRNKRARNKKPNSLYHWTPNSANKIADIAAKPTGVVTPIGSPIVLQPKSHKVSIEIATSIDDQKSVINSFSFDLSTHVGNLFNIRHKPPLPSDFRLDSRLFAKPPFTLDSKVQESHNRIFCGQTSLDTNPGTVAAETTDEITVIEIVKKPTNAVVNHEIVVEEIIILDDDSQPPIVILETANIKKNTPLIVRRKRKIARNNLESDSDESICILRSPSRAPQVVFSLEESSDEEIISMGPPVIPPLIADPQDNSFDFLDSSYDVDALAKSQAKLLSTLIGSKESLIDEHLYQTESSSEKPQSLTQWQDDTSEASTSGNCDVLEQSSKKRPEQVANSSTKTLLVENPEFKAPKTITEPTVRPVTSHIIDVISDVSFSDSDLDVVILTPPPSTDNPSTLLVLRKKSPKKVAKITGSKKLVPTLNIDLNKRDKILEYIDARSKGTLNMVNAQDSENIEEPVKEQVVKSPGPSDNDVVALHSGTMTANLAIDAILLEAEFVGNLDKRSKLDRKQDRKQKRRLKRKHLREMKKRTRVKTKTLQPPIVYTKIEGDELVGEEFRSRGNPRSWTPMMARFYNDSWGDEDFDHEAIKQTMSSNPHLWRVMAWDRSPNMYGRGPGNRCGACGGCHHTHLCSLRTPKCHMCGTSGHAMSHCPNSMCLQCGQPGDRFVESCRRCEDNQGGQHRQANQEPVAKRARYSWSPPVREKPFTRGWPDYMNSRPHKPFWRD